ncbi:MAG: ATP-binding cassette domain-containing protein, partial [Burkholderiaceae bacterium]
MLTIRDLHAGYGAAAVLQGVNAQVQGGEIVAVLGRNGSGRSTLAKAVMGMVSWRGIIEWNGESLAGKRTFEIARGGIGYVPETRDVFAGLTVHQNLQMGVQRHHRHALAPSWDTEALYRLFPALHL